MSDQYGNTVDNEVWVPCYQRHEPMPGVHQDVPHANTQCITPSKENTVSDNGEVSDGYHTFNELYEFRKLYNAALFNEWAAASKYGVHKSWRHSDGEACFGGGWFIVTAQLPTGQISNHYEAKDWDLFQLPEWSTAERWDGHTAADVAERLHRLASPPRV